MIYRGYDILEERNEAGQTRQRVYLDGILKYGAETQEECMVWIEIERKRLAREEERA